MPTRYPLEQANIARLLARLKSDEQATPLRRAAVEWFQNLSERHIKIDVLYLVTEFYNAVNLRGIRTEPVEALEAIVYILYARGGERVNQPALPIDGKYTIYSMNVSTEEEKTHHAPGEHLLDEIERLEGYNLAIIKVVDPAGNEIKNWKEVLQR